METLALAFQILLMNWQQALTGGIIVACAVIFLFGILKKAWLGKIKNKRLRKVALAFGSLVMVFPLTAIYFALDNISFTWYWYGCALMCGLTIVTYWLYENTALRDFISWVGSRTVNKYAPLLFSAWLVSASDEETNNKLRKATEELKDEVKKELKKQTKEDNELKGL